MREKLIEMLCEAKKLCIMTSCALCPGGGKVGAELGRGTNLTESGGQDGSEKY